MSKILKDLFWLMLAGIAGYFVWRLYKSVTASAAAVGTAASATATTAAAWTPAALGATIWTDIASAGSAIADLFTPGPASPTIHKVDPALDTYYYEQFLNSGTVNSALPGVPASTAWGSTVTNPFIPGGSTAFLGSGAGGSW